MRASVSFWDDAALPLEEVRARLKRARDRDTPFGSGRILGSMCTEPHPVGREAYAQFLETNLGDPALFAGARDLEHKALGLLGDLARAPPGFGGAFVTGGSEANFTALRIALKRTGRREVVLPESAHFSFDKSLDYLGLRPRVARVTPEWRVDVDAVNDLVGPDTAAIVGIAGTTEHGVLDPIPALAEIAHDHGIPMHVDAAFGGFVLPFLEHAGERVPAWDFRLEGVTTMTLDPHKMGMAPIPNGVLLARDAEDLDRVSVTSPYVSVDRQPTLQGTRPGAAAAATWAVMRHLGPDGYAETVQRCMANARHLEERLRGIGIPPIQGDLNVVAFPVADPVGMRARLREKGWFVNLAPLSRGLKVVVMPHVNRTALDAFVPVLQETLREAAADE